jgi:hypothetical protein
MNGSFNQMELIVCLDVRPFLTPTMLIVLLSAQAQRQNNKQSDFQ